MIHFWSFCCPISFDLFEIFENHELENWMPLVKQPRSGRTICKYMEACILCLTFGTVRVFWLVQACTKYIHTGSHRCGMLTWDGPFHVAGIEVLQLQQSCEPTKTTTTRKKGAFKGRKGGNQFPIFYTVYSHVWTRVLRVLSWEVTVCSEK